MSSTQLLNVYDEKLPPIEQVKTTWTDDKRYVIDLPGVSEQELPFVSILTVTRNRSHFLPLSIYNWKRFKYPQNKMEWVIIDDSDTDEMKTLLPEDERIKYFYLKTVLKIADKRNYGVKKCKGTHIVHMDDDDFYFDDSILAKIRVLLKYKDKGCVISLPLGVYNLHNNSSAIIQTQGDDIPEASMTYTKEFWEKQKFGYKPGQNKVSEWYGFITGRREQLINIPFWFNIIALTHCQNTSGLARTISKQESCENFYSKLWDKEMKEIINNLEEVVRKKGKSAKIQKILTIKKYLKDNKKI